MPIEIREPVRESAPKTEQSIADPIKSAEGYVEVIPNDGLWSKSFNDIANGDFSGMTLAILVVLLLIFIKPILWIGKWLILFILILMAAKIYYASNIDVKPLQPACLQVVENS